MGAIITECGEYRYVLTRNVPYNTIMHDANRPCTFIMLNPSTADAEADDPTIRRCMSFARAFEASELVVVNLFAYRATEPDDMFAAHDPVGPLNDRYIRNMLGHTYRARGGAVIACGTAGKNNAQRDLFRQRVRSVRRIAQDCGVVLHALGTTKEGWPRHPLYLPSDAEPLPWEPPQCLS